MRMTDSIQGTAFSPQVILLVCVAGGLLLLIWFATSRAGGGSLNIKMKTVGNGQHGTARWATQKEISQSYTRVLFKVEDWRNGKELPKTQGLILGSTGRKGKVTALVDSDDIHCLMIGASGVVGSLQAMEAVKYIIGQGDLLTGRLLTYDALKMNFRTVKLPKDCNCAVCSDHPSITKLIDYEQAECDLKH